MMISHNDTQLYYEVHGAGAPILAVHGFPLSGRLWADVTPELARRHRLIIPDLRGFGQSRATSDVTMRTYADDLAAILDDARVDEPVTLMGLSMGGYILFEFWRAYPERVARLILANTRAQGDSESAAEGRRATAEKVLAEGSHIVADDMVKKLFASDAPDDLKMEWRDIMAHSSPVGVAAALRAMAARPDSVETLSTITVPTLVITGDEDTIIPLADAELMQRSINQAMLAVINGAGHMTPVESPGAFSVAVQHFMP